jgi:hypothetical protein
MATIVTTSVLDMDDCTEILNAAGEDGLMEQILFAMPYDFAMLDVMPARLYEMGPRTEPGPLPSAPGTVLADRFPEAAAELAPDRPARGYTQEASHKELAYRYEDLPSRIAPTLAGLREDEAFRALVTELRDEGWLDWQILSAVHGTAKNLRLRRDRVPNPSTPEQIDAVMDLFLAPEPDNDPVPPIFFTREELEQSWFVATVSTAQVMWKLKLRKNPVDHEALDRLLRARYEWGRDDVDHLDLFGTHPEG